MGIMFNCTILMLSLYRFKVFSLLRKSRASKKGCFFFSFVPIPYVCTYVGCTGLSRDFSNHRNGGNPQNSVRPNSLGDKLAQTLDKLHSGY